MEVNEKFRKCRVRDAVDKRIKGYLVVGINAFDVSNYTGRHVKRLLEGQSFLSGYDEDKKHAKSLTLRLAHPDHVDVPEDLEDGKNVKDANLSGSEGVSFRIMAKLKKKYKKNSVKDLPPKKNEYDVVLGHMLQGLELCGAPDKIAINYGFGGQWIVILLADLSSICGFGGQIQRDRWIWRTNHLRDKSFC